ncbi:hypothetical protein AD942_07990 [Gluconobacter japonicus]|nr:hypothetical protein AD942_07990 [Gluconobacter japonicus]
MCKATNEDAGSALRLTHEALPELFHIWREWTNWYLNMNISLSVGMYSLPLILDFSDTKI